MLLQNQTSNAGPFFNDPANTCPIPAQDTGLSISRNTGPMEVAALTRLIIRSNSDSEIFEVLCRMPYATRVNA